ncbi:MAG: class B sortase [Gallicola sp.]|nr:class B sortase [Gallicola sp.]
MKYKLTSKKFYKGALGVISILLLLSLTMFARSFYRSAREEKIFYEMQEDMVQVKGKTDENQSDLLEHYKNIKSQNSDFYGWVSIADTKLNYPVMYTPKKPEYYLRRDFNKDYSISGTPFLGEGYVPEGKNAILYGHNMANGAMFSVLSEYKNKDYWKEHPFIQYDTLEGKGKYEIFAVFNIDVEEAKKRFPYHEYTDLREEKRYKEFVSLVKERAFYDTGVEIRPSDELLTLSTCSYHALDGRSVIIAKRIE